MLTASMRMSALLPHRIVDIFRAGANAVFSLLKPQPTGLCAPPQERAQIVPRLVNRGIGGLTCRQKIPCLVRKMAIIANISMVAASLVRPALMHAPPALRHWHAFCYELWAVKKNVSKLFSREHPCHVVTY